MMVVKPSCFVMRIFILVRLHFYIKTTPWAQLNTGQWKVTQFELVDIKWTVVTLWIQTFHFIEHICITKGLKTIDVYHFITQIAQYFKKHTFCCISHVFWIKFYGPLYIRVKHYMSHITHIRAVCSTAWSAWPLWKESIGHQWIPLTKGQ